MICEIILEFNDERQLEIAAMKNEEKVGSVDAWLVLDELQINDVLVDEKYRRQGVASEMIGALRDFGREHYCSRITLEVREGNMPARKLYEKMGFDEVGIRKEYYQDNREDAVLMDLEI